MALGGVFLGRAMGSATAALDCDIFDRFACWFQFAMPCEDWGLLERSVPKFGTTGTQNTSATTPLYCKRNPGGLCKNKSYETNNPL